MQLKTIINYSPNFDLRKRHINQIKFLVFHYTGMKKEKDAILRLTQIQSEVGAHYFIKFNGQIISMVPESYSAWHAGVSSWHKYKSLNKYSIGIEISNPGHQFGYLNFSKLQIQSIIKLSKFLIKKYKIRQENILGHSDISPDRKKDPGERFPWEMLSKNKIGIWHNLNQRELKILRKNKLSFKEKDNFKIKLKKLGYPSKSPYIKKKLQFDKLLAKAFQRRFRPELINGIIDQECLLIINKLLKIY